MLIALKDKSLLNIKRDAKICFSKGRHRLRGKNAKIIRPYTDWNHWLCVNCHVCHHCHRCHCCHRCHLCHCCHCPSIIANITFFQINHLEPSFKDSVSVSVSVSESVIPFPDSGFLILGLRKNFYNVFTKLQNLQPSLFKGNNVL